MAETRVLHVSMPTAAGVPAVLLGYVRDQCARGWSVTVACPTRSGPLAAGAMQSGAAVLDWPAARSPGPATPHEARHLGRLIEAADPDLVHLHSSKAGLAGRLAVRGRRRTVFQPHAWSFLAARGPVRAASVRWERYAARWTDALVCVSEAERRAGARLGIAGAAWIIPNGVDCAVLRPATAADRAVARARLGLPDRPLAVCVGRLCRQKGQADLVAAWPHVRAVVPDALLVLVGDGPDRAALRPRAGAADDVLLAGARTDVPDWLAAGDVVVCPSRWEGMALVPLEAMACGRSVVSTDVAGASEAIPADAGAVVPVGDVTALTRAIVARLADPLAADAEGAAGRAHVARRHDAAAAAAALADVYDHVLDERGADRAARPGYGR